MKISKMATALTLTVALSGSVLAAGTITNADGALSPFSGFEWASGSAAWTTGLVAAEAGINPVTGACAVVGGCSFTINYAGWAFGLTQPGGSGLNAPGLDTDPNGVLNPATVVPPAAAKLYEYTLTAQLTANLVQYVPGVAAVYSVGSGTFNIFYDTTGSADITGGVWDGFSDGLSIIGGTLATANPQLLSLIDGGGQINLVGVVTSQNAAFVNPAILGTNVTSSLQLFPSNQITDFTPPSSVGGVPVDAVLEALFQADANQTFQFATPEPASMLLSGLALLGVGAVTRRRKS